VVTRHLLATFQPGFEALAERDVRAADAKGGVARILETLEPGLWLIAHDDARTLAEGLAHAIAIRHLHPVDHDAALADPPALTQALTPLLASLDPTRSWAVQTRFVGPRLPPWPRAIDVNDAVAALAPNAPYDRRDPAQVLSITIAGPRVLAGLSDTADNLSPFPGGARRFTRTEGSPSRAEHKLLEALEVFAFSPRGRALDLGAAPGGWTSVLAERDLEVTAIDPAELDASVRALPGVKWYRGTAERYLATRAAPVDLVVNDMRMDARDAARLLVDYRPLVARGGHVLTTLKLPERGYLPVLDQALTILESAYTRVHARQLFHNRHEITVLLAPRS